MHADDDGRAMDAGSHPAGGPDGGSDSVVRALAEAHTLIAEAINHHRSRGVNQGVQELPADARASPAVAVRLMKQARQDVIYMLPSPSSGADDDFAGLVSALREAAARDVRLRTLVPNSTLASPTRMSLLKEAHGEINLRVSATISGELMDVDRRLGLVRPEPGHTGEQVLLIRSRPILAMLHTYLINAWDDAHPLAGAASPDAAPIHGTVLQRILRALCDGDKDEVAARKLGLSVRTYRRHVAAIMDNLGAKSRFQAGMRAAELGLLRRAEPAG